MDVFCFGALGFDILFDTQWSLELGLCGEKVKMTAMENGEVDDTVRIFQSDLYSPNTVLAVEMEVTRIHRAQVIIMDNLVVPILPFTD